MIRIYHTSDLHDHRGIVPRLRALRAQEPGLLFDCGDSLRGSQTVYHRNEPIVAEIDAAGYDAQAIGNREFHYLFPFAAGPRRAHAPSAGLHESDRHERPARCLSLPVADLASATGFAFTCSACWSCSIRPAARGSAIFGWRFLDPWDAIAPMRASRRATENCVVVLSHIGLSLDRKLAQRVPRIDLLLGGHSHDTLLEPGVRRRRADRSCRALRAVRFANANSPYEPVRRRVSLIAISHSFRCCSPRRHVRECVLFVTNGHGEAAIAERIAAEVEPLAPQLRLDHLALVGDAGSDVASCTTSARGARCRAAA